MSNTASGSASPAGSTDPARTRERGGETTLTRDDGPESWELEGGACPSCGAADAWTASRRHRFSPFGSVTLLAVSFWVAVVGWLLGIGFAPAGVLAGVAVALLLFTRTAEVCEVCGYVRPRAGR